MKRHVFSQQSLFLLAMGFSIVGSTSACFLDDAGLSKFGESCLRDSDCADGFSCFDQLCVPAVPILDELRDAGGGEPDAGPEPDGGGELLIDTFTADPRQLDGAGEVTFRWTALNADECTLKVDGQTINGDAEDEVTVDVSASDQAKLTCVNLDGDAVTDTENIEVARIVSFVAVPSLERFAIGDRVTLSWETESIDPTACAIEGTDLPNNGDINATDSITVEILTLATHIYTLTCDGFDNEITADVAFASFEPIIPDDVIITTQIDIDQLEGVREIGGSLTFDTTNALDLTPLDSLRLVGGDLVIDDAEAPAQFILQGLETVLGDVQIKQSTVASIDMPSLVTIGGSLSVKNNGGLDSVLMPALESVEIGINFNGNDELTDFDFSALQRINAIPNVLDADLTNPSNGAVVFFDMLSLEEIDLPSLQSVPGLFKVVSCPALTSIQAPELRDNFTTGEPILIGDIGIEFNPQLREIDFSSLEGAGRFFGVIIKDNDSLINLNGFNNLARVAGDLIIEENDALQTIEQLTSLFEVTGRLFINNNNNLARIKPLPVFEIAQKGITIKNNANLVAIDAQPALSLVGNREQVLDIESGLIVTDNPRLTDFANMPSLQQLAHIVVINNDALLALLGPTAITQVFGRIEVRDNENIQQLGGFPALTTVGGIIVVNNNARLQRIDGFGQLQSIGASLENLPPVIGTVNVTGIAINANPALTNIAGFDALTELQEGINVENNLVLQEIGGFTGLIDVAGGMRFSNLPQLTRLIGFNRVKGIQGGLIVDTCANLVNFNNFAGVTTVGGKVTVQNNARLSNIQMPSVVSVGDFEIINNDALGDLAAFCALATVSGTFRVNGNAVLNDFTGLSNLKTINTRIEVNLNPNLATCKIEHLANQCTVRPPVVQTGNKLVTGDCAFGVTTCSTGNIDPVDPT